MNKQLKELLLEKRKIEEQIKALKSGAPIIVGNAKIDRETYVTALPDRWYIALKVTRNGSKYQSDTRYVSIFNGKCKEQVIDAIPSIIHELQGLYDYAKQQEDMNGSN